MEDLFNLKERVVLITGGAGFLGRVHAEAIGLAGGIPVLLDIHKDRLDECVKQLGLHSNFKVVPKTVDITDEDQIRIAVEEILHEFGHIDGLVNNAAINPKTGEESSRLENFDLEIWNQDIAVGLTGAFLCAKHYGYKISQNPDGGVILNISSDLGLIAPDQRLYRQQGLPEDQQPVKPVTYSVVKTGLIGLTRYLATYWPDRVRCNALCPGGVEAGQSDDFLKEVSARIPMGRLAKANEYQGALLFLLSDSSAYLNGAILPMDGGRGVW